MYGDERVEERDLRKWRDYYYLKLNALLEMLF